MDCYFHTEQGTSFRLQIPVVRPAKGSLVDVFLYSSVIPIENETLDEATSVLVFLTEEAIVHVVIVKIMK